MHQHLPIRSHGVHPVSASPLPTEDQARPAAHSGPRLRVADLHDDSGNESMQTVLILAVSAMVLTALLNVGRTVLQGTQQKATAALSEAPDSASLTVASTLGTQSRTQANIPASFQLTADSQQSPRKITSAADLTNRQMQFDTGTYSTNPKPESPDTNNPDGGTEDEDEENEGGEEEKEDEEKEDEEDEEQEEDDNKERPGTRPSRPGSPPRRSERPEFEPNGDDFGSGVGSDPRNAVQGNGMQQGGFPQAGFPQAGMPQTGFPQNGFAQGGFPQPAAPQTGFPQTGFPPNPYGSTGFPQQPIFAEDRQPDRERDTSRRQVVETPVSKPTAADQPEPIVVNDSHSSIIQNLLSGQAPASVPAATAAVSEPPDTAVSEPPAAPLLPPSTDSNMDRWLAQNGLSGISEAAASLIPETSAITVVGVDRKQPGKPRLLLEIHTALDRIYLKIADQTLAFAAPEDGYGAIPLTEAQALPGTKITVIGAQGKLRQETEFEVPILGQPEPEASE